jgi:hypothetical protein
METTHSKTRRAKGSSPKIVVQSWDKVWESFKEDHTKTTIEAMNAEGWKTLEQASLDSGVGRTTIRHLASNGKVEKAKVKVFFMGATREMTFFRPKT